jgi:hypothetical protein
MFPPILGDVLGPGTLRVAREDVDLVSDPGDPGADRVGVLGAGLDLNHLDRIDRRPVLGGLLDHGAPQLAARDGTERTVDPARPQDHRPADQEQAEKCDPDHLVFTVGLSLQRGGLDPFSSGSPP